MIFTLHTLLLLYIIYTVRCAKLLRIQSGDANILSNAVLATVDLNETPDMSKSFVTFTLKGESDQKPCAMFVTVEYQAVGNQLHFQRGCPSSSDVFLTFFLVEFESGARVLHGKVQPFDFPSVATPSFDAQRTFPLTSFRASDGVPEMRGTCMFETDLHADGNGFTLRNWEVYQGSEQPCFVEFHWQLVELEGVEVFKHRLELPANKHTAEIALPFTFTPERVNRTIVLAGTSLGDSGTSVTREMLPGEASLLVDLVPENDALGRLSPVVRVHRYDASSVSALNTTFYAVSFNDGSRVFSSNMNVITAASYEDWRNMGPNIVVEQSIVGRASLYGGLSESYYSEQHQSFVQLKILNDALVRGYKYGAVAITTDAFLIEFTKTPITEPPTIAPTPQPTARPTKMPTEAPLVPGTPTDAPTMRPVPQGESTTTPTSGGGTTPGGGVTSTGGGGGGQTTSGGGGSGGGTSAAIVGDAPLLSGTGVIIVIVGFLLMLVCILVCLVALLRSKKGARPNDALVPINERERVRAASPSEARSSYARRQSKRQSRHSRHYAAPAAAPRYQMMPTRPVGPAAPPSVVYETGAVLSKVVRGQVVLTSNTVGVSLLDVVDESLTMHRHTYRFDLNVLSAVECNTFVSARLRPPPPSSGQPFQLIFERGCLSSGPDITIDWQVAIFESGINVVHGSIDTGSPSWTLDVQSEQLNSTQTFPLISWHTTSDSSWADTESFHEVLLNRTTPFVSSIGFTAKPGTSASDPTVDIFYQLVDYDGAIVVEDRVFLEGDNINNMALNEVNVLLPSTYTPEVIRHTWILFSHSVKRARNSIRMSDVFLRSIVREHTPVITFRRYAPWSSFLGQCDDLHITFLAVTFTDGTRVFRDESEDGLSVTSLAASVALPAGVEVDKALVGTSSTVGIGAEVEGSTGLYDFAHGRMTFTLNDTAMPARLDMVRQNANNDARVDWYLLHFNADDVTVSSTDAATSAASQTTSDAGSTGTSGAAAESTPDATSATSATGAQTKPASTSGTTASSPMTTTLVSEPASSAPIATANSSPTSSGGGVAVAPEPILDDMVVSAIMGGLLLLTLGLIAVVCVMIRNRRSRRARAINSGGGVRMSHMRRSRSRERSRSDHGSRRGSFVGNNVHLRPGLAPADDIYSLAPPPRSKRQSAISASSSSMQTITANQFVGALPPAEPGISLLRQESMLSVGGGGVGAVGHEYGGLPDQFLTENLHAQAQVSGYQSTPALISDPEGRALPKPQPNSNYVMMK